MSLPIALLLALLAAAAGVGAGLLLGARRWRGQAETAQLQAAIDRARLEAERQHAAQALQATAAELRAEFRAVAHDLAQTEGQSLRAEHQHALESLLAPLGRNIETFREQFIAGNAAMDRYARELMARAESVGREAGELARALRGNNKLQGNWGEAVLAGVLQAAGLEAGRDFDVQRTTRDDDGRRLIPDVVVHLPEGREVIVDSKVSLTAYVAAAAEPDEQQRERLMHQHVASVRRHVKELSQKDYAAVVPGSIGYVLMFIPAEAAFAAALAAEPGLPAEAYAARVILVNPTNLLMALQLAHNLWLSDVQRRSVGEIYASAEKLYKKFALFAQTFTQLGRGARQLTALYDKAERQLATGRGSIVSQLEGWRKKGVSPAAQLPEALLHAAGEDEADDETSAALANVADAAPASEADAAPASETAAAPASETARPASAEA